MSGLFRSETMTYVRVIMSDDSALDTVRELGRLAKLHVVDLATDAATSIAGAAPSESANTHYKKRVILCQFYERKLFSFLEAMRTYHVPVPDSHSVVASEPMRSSDIIEDCRAYLEPLENSLTKNVLFRKTQRVQVNEYIEYIQVLKYAKNNALAAAGGPVGGREEAIGEGGSYQVSSDAYDEEAHTASSSSSGGAMPFTRTIVGVIPADKILAFERLLFRTSRGNALSHFQALPGLSEDPTTGVYVLKHIFSVTFIGDQLARRIGRVVTVLGATEYALPTTGVSGIERMEQDMQRKLVDCYAVLTRTDEEIRELLSSLALDAPPLSSGSSSAPNSPYLNWQRALQKERLVCSVMRKCSAEGPHSKMVTLEAWCPTDALDDLRSALHQAVRATQAKQAALQVLDHAPDHANPPTYFKTNAFTESFQGIVDTYGVPRYKEVNPGLFTVISFPFLFGISTYTHR
jgi:V-type H+-transporting ATPase subunit a